MADTSPSSITRGSERLTNYVRLLRPEQWLKNVFVFAPLVFAKELFDLQPVLTALQAFVGFSLTASAVYAINDITDIESDRLHPRKKDRPLASRALSTSEAFVIVAVLIIGVGLLTINLDARYAVVLSLYFLLNLAYSLGLKEVILLDVFVISAGFILRVLAGAYAIDVSVSSWIILCTLFISLFLGFSKRRAELSTSHRAGAVPGRKVLALYRVEFVDQMLTLSAAGAVISYALYTVAERTLEIFGTDNLIYTTVFVLFGIFRYFYLAHTTDSAENPAGLLTSDLPIVATVFLWILSCVAIIYFGGTVH